MLKESVLIVDDEMSICTSLCFALENQFDARYATTPAQALKALRERRFDICLLDLCLGRFDGIELLEAMRGMDPSMVIIIMTAYGSIESSVSAVRKGAYTYLTKPLGIEMLLLTLRQALEYREQHAKVDCLSRELATKHTYCGMIGKSRAMSSVFQMIEKLKDIDVGVMISGESGTGKELVAHALHVSGKRRNNHFAVVNCAAIPEGLLEGELFGHKMGAFTGAVSDQQGMLEYANGGTLFLDEIGDMPLALQAKILRVLQEKEYRPLGSNQKRQLNIRFVAASNRDLQKMVDEGSFRQDLYFRLNVVEIRLPPLRERREDLPLLIDHLIQANNDALGKKINGISKETQLKFHDYPYPGNVRELINIIEYAMILCEGSTIELEHLPRQIRDFQELAANRLGLFSEDLTGLPLEEVERRVITANLEKSGGHRVETAKVLGISEKGLRNKIAKYSIILPPRKT
jgi:two-component system response regulator AtoC